MADADLKNTSYDEDILINILPLGFSTSKVIIHNVAVILAKLFSGERLYVIENNPVQGNLLVMVLNYWLHDVVSADSFLLNTTVDLLETLVKCAYFCKQFNSPSVLSQLMAISKYEVTSSQSKTKLLKILSYLSRGQFHNSYNPARGGTPGSRHGMRPPMREQGAVDRGPALSDAPIRQGGGGEGYKPSFLRDDTRSLEPPQASASRKEMSYPTKDTSMLPQRSEDFQVPRQRQQAQGDRLMKNPTIFRDYLNLLHSDNTGELLHFAITNLAEIIDECIDDIMADSDAYLKLMNVLELNLPPELQPLQEKLMSYIAGGLNEPRAKDGCNKRAVARILRAFTYQPTSMHPVLYSLIEKHLKLSKFRVDLATLIQMIQSPYNVLQELGVKALAVISDPNFSENPNYEIQFENHIKYLLELTINPKKSTEFKNAVLQVIANLAIRDSLKAQLVYARAMDYLVKHIRTDDNLDGQRLAAKALLNLTINSKDAKLKIVTELSEEIKRLYRGELDSIVASYLSSIIKK
jgi:hypothetical protein